MGVIELRPASYRGKHNNSRLTLLVLLEQLQRYELPWTKGGEYHSLRQLASANVEKLSYSYLRVRLPKLALWGYVSARPISASKGRPVQGYRLGKKGAQSIERSPPVAYSAALVRVYSALPRLDPGRFGTRSKVGA